MSQIPTGGDTTSMTWRARGPERVAQIKERLWRKEARRLGLCFLCGEKGHTATKCLWNNYESETSEEWWTAPEPPTTSPDLQPRDSDRKRELIRRINTYAIEDATRHLSEARSRSSQLYARERLDQAVSKEEQDERRWKEQDRIAKLIEIPEMPNPDQGEQSANEQVEMITEKFDELNIDDECPVHSW